jgi:hypothetical protein
MALRAGVPRHTEGAKTLDERPRTAQAMAEMAVPAASAMGALEGIEGV